MDRSRAGAVASVVAVLSGLLGASLGCSESNAGCKKDSDCKGDRVCQRGECKVADDDDDEPKKKPTSGASKDAPSNPAVPLQPRPDAPTPAPPSPAPAPAALPKVNLASCKDTEGRWATYMPMVEHVVAAARTLPHTGCLRGEEIAGALSQCGGERRHGLVTADATVPGHTACTVGVHTLELGERRWINISVFVGNDAQFHSESYIVEMRPEGPSKYYFGFTGASPLCAGSNEPDAQGSETSPLMRSEWGSLGANVRTDFFCADGSNLAAPEAAPPAPAPAPACAEGTTAACDCPGIGKGTHRCAGGVWSGCNCRDTQAPAGRCVEGTTRACPCGDGTNGQATCVDGRWVCAMCD